MKLDVLLVQTTFLGSPTGAIPETFMLAHLILSAKGLLIFHSHFPDISSWFA
jgi:hypothetical protein